MSCISSRSVAASSRSTGAVCAPIERQQPEMICQEQRASHQRSIEVSVRITTRNDSAPPITMCASSGMSTQLFWLSGAYSIK